MIYSNVLDMKISRLGFGCMRFRIDETTGEIDQRKVNDMFDLAISKGVNYFDTAYPYLNGKSELAVAEALSRYPRNSYYLSDKFPGHSLPGPVDNIALFNLELKKCRTEYFDFYLLHNVTEWSVKIYEDEKYHIVPDMIEMKKQGKIRHLGFSFHGGPALLEEFLNRHEGIFEFVQIQCNYLDWTLQDARKKYDIITAHGLPVWVMEPCRGGKLAVLNESQSARLKEFRPDASDASFAFRFLQSLDNIKVILSGMNEVSQVEDNLNTFRDYDPVSEEEKAVLFDIAEGMKKGVPCTGCRYCCEGCPMGLNIPYLLECYNDYKYAVSLSASVRLDGLDEDKKPANCIGCGQCSHACPQGIDVPAALAELTQMYADGPNWSTSVQSRHESIKRDLNMK